MPVAPLALKYFQQKANIKIKISFQMTQRVSDHFYLLLFTVRFRFWMFLRRTALVLLIFFLSKGFLNLGWRNQVPLWFLPGAFSCLRAGSVEVGGGKRSLEAAPRVPAPSFEYSLVLIRSTLIVTHHRIALT